MRVQTTARDQGLLRKVHHRDPWHSLQHGQSATKSQAQKALLLFGYFFNVTSVDLLQCSSIPTCVTTAVVQRDSPSSRPGDANRWEQTAPLHDSAPPQSTLLQPHEASFRQRQTANDHFCP